MLQCDKHIRLVGPFTPHILRKTITQDRLDLILDLKVHYLNLNMAKSMLQTLIHGNL